MVQGAPNFQLAFALERKQPFVVGLLDDRAGCGRHQRHSELGANPLLQHAHARNAECRRRIEERSEFEETLLLRLASKEGA